MQYSYKIWKLDLQAGDVVLNLNKFYWYNPMRYLALIIRLFTFKKANHVRVLSEHNGELMINEAWLRIICSPITKLQQYQTKIIVLTPVVPVDGLEFSKKANKKLGISYWVAGLFYQAWYIMTGKWKGGEQEEKMFCSQYAAWCHGLGKPYLYSAKELMQSPHFKVKWIEP